MVWIEETSKSVLCWKCSAALCEPPVVRKPKVEGDAVAVRNPKGWRFMKVYVNADKEVYYKGVEQPELKGTLEPTVIVAKPKKSTAQKEIDRVAKEAKLAAKHAKKQAAARKDEARKQKKLDQLEQDAK